jgi:rod shape-determining protein MreB and related proteins
MLKSKDIYIDLGTSNTLIYVKGLGMIINEPTLVVKKNLGQFNEQTVSLGKLAKKMLGKTPVDFDVIKPLREGVISNLDVSANLIKTLLKNYQQNHYWSKPKLIISLPCEVATHERMAIQSLGESIGAGKIELIDEPVAAALGAGLDILSSKGHMVVDIGGGTTEAVVLSLGGIVVSAAVRSGGESLTESIVQHLRIYHNFLIGESTAEVLKIKIADGTKNRTNSLQAIVGGIDLNSGLPQRKAITSEMIYKPVEAFIEKILLVIKKTFEECPPELAADIHENGILLAGGGAGLTGLADRINQETGVKTYSSRTPLLDVSIGGSKLVDHPEILEKIKAGS